ncbi:putative ribonuclease H-like domain-containing protein [Tanacetum coccineum]
MSGSQDEIPPPPSPPSSSQTPTQQTPHTVSTIKLSILKKGEYDIWAMKIEYYLAHTDYLIWEVIQNGNDPVSITTDTQGQIKVALNWIIGLGTLDEFDLEENGFENDCRMLQCHKTGHFARECRTKGNQDSRRRDAWNSGNKDGRRSGKQEDSKALVTIDGEGVDWTSHSEEEEDYALMACNSSGSDTEAYTQGLKKVEAQLVAHQQGQLWYEEKIRYDGILSYENEVLQSVFIGKESDFENPSLYDRFVTAGGMHAVPPPMTGNYMPSGPDIEIDYSKFTYGPKQTQPSESETQTSDIDTCESNISTEPPELVSEPVVNESNVESQPKVWSDAPIIEEYELDSEDEETVKNHFTHSKNPKVDKKELGYGFTARACFVCGSLNHLIRDCDFHEKRMAKQAVLNNRMKRNSSQREIRPIWNNVQRVNHQNQFVPTAVLTRTGKIPVNTARASGTKNVSTARHSFNRQAVLTSAAMKVNTVKPIVNRLVLLGGKRETAVKPSAGCNWRQKGHYWKNISKYNSGSNYPHRALKHKGIIDSGCSRYMTRNKAYLGEYQDFNGGPIAFGGSKGYITGKGKIKTGKLDFEDVCFVKELQQFNLFSVSQICDKKNKVLFTDSECLVLSPEFKLPDENQVLLKIPRQNNMYSFKLENIVPSGGLACLIAKAIIDESNKWHKRLGHVNFKNLNKLVKGNLVRGLPSKIFQNDHTCVACQKGKQHKASCKAKSVSSISHSLQLLHMDLFGPTSVRSLNHKTYCLVITDDFSRFSWVFFLRTKDETSGILKDFIRQIENQLNQKVKTIRCDNGTEFKNRDFIELCGSKGIKREYSNARTPQQNGVAERKNRTLIEAARTMLADSFLPNTFWAEAVSTACYVLNRVLVTKPHNKTPYELVTGKIPIISYIRPFGCHVTILNTIDHLGKFDGKSDEGFLVGYSLQSKAFRVYNLETKRVEENLHITFLETKPNVAGKGPTWLFDLDYLTDSMNYQPVRSENQANKHAGPQEANHNAGTKDNIDAGDSEKEDESAQDYFVLPIWSSYSSTVQDAMKRCRKLMRQLKLLRRILLNNRDLLRTIRVAKPSSTNIVNTASTPVSTASTDNDLPNPDQDDSEIPALEEIYKTPTEIQQSAVQTRSKVNKSSEAYAFVRKNAVNQDSESLDSGRHCLLGHRQEEQDKIPDEVFAPVARIEAIRIFLAFASYIGFIVYQMDVKNAFCYGKMDEEVYVSQPPGELTFFLGLQVKQKADGIFISQDKYVAEILKKFDFVNIKTASTPIETQKPLVKDEEASDVNVHLYRSMIGSLMYLTASRPDIMFAVCACSRRLISWKCKKQTIVATSTTEAEYVVAANCCGHVLWIQNQLLDYGFNFMNTNIYIDNESTICIVKNLVYHSKTKHIAIRYHFIRDAYENKLIQVLKIHTYDNVVDLLTKAFDVSRFQFLVVTIGMINP